MNSSRYRFARRQCIHKLPDVDRRLYTFIEQKEKQLAAQSETKDHYIRLLKHQSPVDAAAVAFGMKHEHVCETLQIIEKYIQAQIPEQMKKMKFVAYTKQCASPVQNEVKYFLFTDK